CGLPFRLPEATPAELSQAASAAGGAGGGGGAPGDTWLGRLPWLKVGVAVAVLALLAWAYAASLSRAQRGARRDVLARIGSEGDALASAGKYADARDQYRAVLALLSEGAQSDDPELTLLAAQARDGRSRMDQILAAP